MPATRARRRDVNLPAELSSFIGRHREVAEVKRLLQVSRLVTVTGVGGVGKTRLALRAAHEVHRAFREGVWFVDLSALRDGALVPHEVARAFGLRGHSDRGLEAGISDYLADKQLLLILDNCEHLVDAAAMSVATILRAAPDIRILATSRQPLGITGEYVLPLSAMSLPAADQPAVSREAVSRYDALSLFRERARATTPSFDITPGNLAAIVELCRSLDGVPLAIELAAAKLRLLSPEQILAHLGDRFQLLTSQDRSVPERQQSLYALVDWSYDLCSTEEQTLWRKLAVFPGSFDLDAAAVILAEDEFGHGRVLHALAGLVDRSIVVPEPAGSRMRYRAPETIREYGLARTAGVGEQSSLQRRHRDYFLAFARKVEANWCTPEQRDWMGRLADETDNFRAALDFSLSGQGEERTALDLSGALWLHWLLNGLLREGRLWLERALGATEEPCRERAKALWVDAYLRLYQGDAIGASRQLELSQRIADALEDPEALADVVEFRGIAAQLGSDWAAMSVHSMEALEMHRALGNRFRVIVILARLALAAHLMGDTAHADSFHARAMAESEETGEVWGRSHVQWIHGIMLFDQGDLRGASTEVRASLLVKQAFGDRLGMAQCIEVLAWIAAARRAHDRAAQLLGFAQATYGALGGRFFPLLQDRDTKCRDQVEAALGKQLFGVAFDRGTSITVDEGMAVALEGAGPRRNREGVSPQASNDGLTRRELEIAGLVAAGLSNKAIAARLVISQRTAEAHVEHILTKLGFRSRAQIAAWTRERQAAEPDSTETADQEV